MLRSPAVYYSVDLPGGADEPANQRPEDAGRLSILNDVSGAFRPNILTAFMGETGAGKTTLLDVLADRKTGGKIEGDIRVNVRRGISIWLAHQCGACPEAACAARRRAPCVTPGLLLAGSPQGCSHLCPRQRVRGADRHPLAAGAVPRISSLLWPAVCTADHNSIGLLWSSCLCPRSPVTSVGMHSTR